MSEHSVISSSEVAFPRGGSTALTALEVKEISNEATKDVLFEVASKEKKRAGPASGGKKLKKQKTASDDEPKVEIEHFNFSNMAEGAKVLGQITRINKLDLEVALGDNLRAFVPITYISEEVTKKVEEADDSDDEEEGDIPSLAKLFTVGQWVTGVVMPREEAKKRILLSLETSTVNRGLETDDLVAGNVLQVSVKSVEDHGVLLTTGLSVGGFMSNKELEAADITPASLAEGQVLLASVVSKSNGRTVTLRPAVAVQNLKKATVSTISSVDAIRPGMVVDALVADVSDDGVHARVFGMVDGTFSIAQVGVFDRNNLTQKFPIGSSHKARVIAVVTRQGAKKLILSKLKAVLSLDTQAYHDGVEAFAPGHVFDEVSVKYSDLNYIYVEFGTHLRGQVHNSNIDPDLQLNNYPVGSKHKARVFSYNAIDQVLVLTLNPKLVKAKFLNTDSIPVGAFVEGQVVKILDGSGGLIVDIDGFEALVPTNHMSDIKLVYPERKFRVGQKIRARVLSKYGRKLLVTVRKSLVSLEDDEVLADVSKATVGFRTKGTVDRFVPNGAIILFFGQARAFLPKNEISESFIAQASDYLKVGQSVTATITEVKENNRLTVTLRQSLELNQEQVTAIEKIVVGRTFVKATVVEKTKDSAIVDVGHGLRGVLDAGHLEDGNYEQSRAALKKLTVGDALEVLVLDKDLRARAVTVTAKPSLIETARSGELPVVFEELSKNKVVHGYIKSITSMGAFVAFGGRLTGLISPRVVDDFSVFFKNQSIACDVIRLTEDTERFWLAPTEDTNNGPLRLVNPLDKYKKASQYVPGVVTKGLVKSIKPGYAVVQLADNLTARADTTQLFKSLDDIENPSAPLEILKGKTLSFKVIGFHDSKKDLFSTVGQAGPRSVISLALDGVDNFIQKNSLVPGQEYLLSVRYVANGFVGVSPSPGISGRVSVLNLSDDASVAANLEAKLPVGAVFTAKYSSYNTEHNVAVFANRTHPFESFGDVVVGASVPVRVLKIAPAYVLVGLGEDIIASAFITDALNNFDHAINEVYRVGDFVQAKVLAVDAANRKIAVSLRDEESAVDKPIDSLGELRPGKLVKGFVKSITQTGLYISLGRSIYALVRPTDISDVPSDDWKHNFHPYQVVTGKILTCHSESRVSMTLKDSDVNGSMEVLKTFGELEEGDIYEGTIKKVMDFGVFVKLDGTFNVSGLCHRSEISDNKNIENVTGLFGEGDRVKVKVLSVDAEKQRISLGMKASYFTEDMEVDEDESEDEVNMDSDDELESEDDQGAESDASAVSIGDGLSTQGFDWTASILDQAEDEESSDEEDFTVKKKKKSKRVEDKTGDINSRAPQSTADFERLLVGNSNSSILWMNYMSFQLQLSEIDKAREIGERALKTINYREEQEKMNIWIALLNLENTFGTDELLQDVFKRATQYMDSLTMHQKLVGIYTMSDKFEQAEELYTTMTKKFAKVVAVWVSYGSYLLDRKQHDEAHEVLAKSLQVLPKRDHIEVVRKFAQLEFAKGDPEQGRSLFEGLVADAPKKIDLWNVYIDQEIKHNERAKVEALFERVITKKLTRKQAKFFFSKWLSFEETQGDEKAATRVKALATEYVQKHQE